MVPNLLYYDWIVVNSSAGKDSQASLDIVVKRAKEQGFPLDRILVAHAILEEEWAGTKELATEHAAHYGLRYEERKRPQGTLLQQVEERGMWPSNSQRYCTSDHKRGQIERLLTQLGQEHRESGLPYGSGRRTGTYQRHRSPICAEHDGGPGIRGLRKVEGVKQGTQRVGRHQRRDHETKRAVLNYLKVKVKRHKVRILSVFGFRSEESPARKKMVPFEKDRRQCNGRRHVDRWLPIHHFTERQVWHQIKKAGTRMHWAYARGMKRLSCIFCIFAPRNQLLIAASQPENKTMLEKYVQVEIKTGHKFRVNQSLQEIADAVQAGEKPKDPATDTGCWNM